MPKETEKQRIFSRRAVIFGGVQMAAFGALAARLGYLQFFKADEYATLSENNRIKLQLIAPMRGAILDRNGQPLATNEKNYRLFLDYSSLGRQSLKETLARLRELMPLPEKKLKQLENARVTPATMPELLKEHLTWEEVSLVELHMLSLPGVFIDIGQIRHYPLEDEAAHLLGYVAAVSESELSADDQPLMRLPNFKIGKNGVEKMLESTLRGTAGIKQMEVNVHGVPVREVGKKESIPGEVARLTIDARLQQYAAELVKDQSAAVVVMEVDTGNVLALVSMPGFDPNSFSMGISTEEWKRLSGDKKVPLMNKAISGQYPPGSTFKMLVGMAGLEAGAIRPGETVYCPGHFMLGDHRFNCWKPEGHGSVDYHQAVAQSCDTFFYTVAQKLGIDPFARMARRFGLGHTHNLGMVGEKPGVIPDAEWKMKSYNQRWTGGDTINCAIGQGYVLATPLQLCIMAARMAGGFAVEPRLFVPPGQENPRFKPLGVGSDILQRTQAAMDAVVNNPRGTAYGKRIADPRYAFGGKTGTSQVRKITQRGMNQNLLPWEARHHALFVGFAPVDKPKYACCVVVEHGGGGSAAAAPVAREVLLKAQQFTEYGPDATLETLPKIDAPPPPPPAAEPVEELPPPDRQETDEPDATDQ